MRGSNNSFLSAISCNPSMFPTLESNITTADSNHEFIVDSNKILTSTLADGILAVSYLKYPTTESGEILIPDNENLKEALLYYCLSRFFLKKDIMGDKDAGLRYEKYKTLFGHHAAKAAAELVDPDITEMETLSANGQRLVPRSNQFDNFFSKLSGRESLSY